ncbi:DUF5673 domain-containing protein [candidate division KSB1 bacterium]
MTKYLIALSLLCIFGIMFTMIIFRARRVVGKKAVSRNKSGIIFLGVILIGAMVLTIVFIFNIPPVTIAGQEIPAIYLLILISSLVAVFSYIIQSRKQENILLDLGRSEFYSKPKTEYFTFILGAVLLLIGIIRSFDLKQVILGLAFLANGFFMLFLKNLKNTRITEKGIIQAGGLLKWEKIESYEWASDNENTLSLKVKRPRVLGEYANIPVPSAFKEEVNKIMKERIPEINVE